MWTQETSLRAHSTVGTEADGRTGQEQGRHSRTGLGQNLTQGRKRPQGRSASRPQSCKHLGSLRSRQAGAWKLLPAAPAAVAHVSPTRGADRLRRRKDGGVICLSCSLSLCVLETVTPTFIEFNIDEPLPHYTEQSTNILSINEIPALCRHSCQITWNEVSSWGTFAPGPTQGPPDAWTASKALPIISPSIRYQDSTPAA